MAARVLVLLTDGHDLGSTNLAGAGDRRREARQRDRLRDRGRRETPTSKPLTALARATGGRRFDAADAGGLGAAYRSLARELDRTWQLSYLSRARAGDVAALSVRAGGSGGRDLAADPGGDGTGGLLPRLRRAATRSRGGRRRPGRAALRRRGRRRTPSPPLDRDRRVYSSRTSRARDRPRSTGGTGPPASSHCSTGPSGRWTTFPARSRLARMLERSGLKLRAGHVPYLAIARSLRLRRRRHDPRRTARARAAADARRPRRPRWSSCRIVARRRTQAFDRQLPDVLATIASTLRAGHGLRTALRAIADDGAAPSSEEFGRVLGEETARAAARRGDRRDVRADRVAPISSTSQPP